MRNIKLFFWVAGLGGLVGALLFAWFSPKVIEWYFSPPAELALSCKPAVQWAIDSYRKAVLAGAIVGSVLSVLFLLAFGLRSRPPQPPASGGGAMNLEEK